MELYSIKGKQPSRSIRLGLSYEKTVELDKRLMFQGFRKVIMNEITYKRERKSRPGKGRGWDYDFYTPIYTNLHMSEDFDRTYSEQDFYKGRDESLSSRTFTSGDTDTKCVSCDSITFYIREKDVEPSGDALLTMIKMLISSIPAKGVFVLPALTGGWKYKDSVIQQVENFNRTITDDAARRAALIKLLESKPIFDKISTEKLTVNARVNLCADGDKMFELFNIPVHRPPSERYGNQGVNVDGQWVTGPYWVKVVEGARK